MGECKLVNFWRRGLGIEITNIKLVEIGKKKVLLLERFDREHRDYLELIDFMMEYGVNVTKNLNELFKRIAFTISVNNTDDHLRNHGFLWSGNGWELSPMFDVNPNPNKTEERVTSIAGAATREESFAALLENSNLFRVKKHQAQDLINSFASSYW
ncbi:MAG: HipA domain-containing protein [Candidatus Ancillula sp.]|nr:HipA domain-containing protein [Candidatus Ancillula sp.]